MKTHHSFNTEYSRCGIIRGGCLLWGGEEEEGSLEGASTIGDALGARLLREASGGSRLCR